MVVSWPRGILNYFQGCWENLSVNSLFFLILEKLNIYKSKQEYNKLPRTHHAQFLFLYLKINIYTIAIWLESLLQVTV